MSLAMKVIVFLFLARDVMIMLHVVLMIVRVVSLGCMRKYEMRWIGIIIKHSRIRQFSRHLTSLSTHGDQSCSSYIPGMTDGWMPESTDSKSRMQSVKC